MLSAGPDASGDSTTPAAGGPDEGGGDAAGASIDPAVNASFVRRLVDESFDDAEVEAGRTSFNLGLSEQGAKGWFGLGGPYPKDMTTITVSGKMEVATVTLPGEDKPVTGPVTTASVVGSGTPATEAERPHLKLVLRRVREFGYRTVF